MLHQSILRRAKAALNAPFRQIRQLQRMPTVPTVLLKSPIPTIR
jgi:hypothetical protein